MSESGEIVFDGKVLEEQICPSCGKHALLVIEFEVEQDVKHKARCKSCGYIEDNS